MGLAAVLICPLVTLGGQVEPLVVTQDVRTFTISLNAEIEAPRTFVFETLTDYANLEQLTGSILESRILGEHPDTGIRLGTLTRLCILIFCMDLRQIQDMKGWPHQRMTGVIASDEGDITDGHAEWRFEDVGTATRMDFDAVMTTRFWVPPIIGPLLVQQMLWREAELIVEGLERKYDRQLELR